MSNPEIHTWFPKALFIQDNLLTDKLPTYEQRIKDLLSGIKEWRTDMLSVDSTHAAGDQLHTDPAFTDLAEAILKNAGLFLKELGYSQEFIKEIKIANMWANVSNEGDFLFPHVHPNSMISGAFYIKRAENSKIKFFGDMLTSMLPEPTEVNALNFKFCEYDCNPGRLIMFKSDFLHGTGKQGPGEKIVVSFNIQYKN